MARKPCVFGQLRTDVRRSTFAKRFRWSCKVAIANFDRSRPDLLRCYVDNPVEREWIGDGGEVEEFEGVLQTESLR